MIRACVNCEVEQKILDRSDRTKTHGVCRRHFTEFILSLGCSDTELKEAVATVSTTGFCPDLSENNADALQKQYTLHPCK